MKKSIIIAISAIGVVAIGAVIYVYLTFFNGTDFSKNIPKNSVFVMKVDLMGMGKKINLKEATESKAFRKEIMENMKSSQKDMMEKVMSNPLKSGLQLASKPTLFLFNNSKTESEPVMGFMFGISDKKNFNLFLEEIAKDATIKEPDQDGFYKANFNSNEGFVLYFNDKIGLFLMDLENKDLALKRVRDEIVGLDKDKSILSNEEYSSLNSQSNDMMVYFNGKELVNVLELNKNNSNDQLKKTIEAYPYAMTLNFNEDAISVKSYMSKSASTDALSMLKEGGISESELKNIDPKGNPLFFMTMNFDFKKTLEIISEQSKLYQPYSSGADIFNQIDNIAAELNIPKEDILNLFKGKMSLSFSGMKQVSAIDPYTLSTITKPLPIINGWAKLGNKEAATKILDALVTENALTFEEGIYSEKTYGNSPSVYIGMKGDDLFVSSDKDALVSKIQGADWNSLKDDFSKTTATKQPVFLYGDLRYSSYESMIKSNLSENESGSIDKFKNILSSFKSISVSGNNKEVEMIIQLSEKKTNSLQRIIELLQEAYRLTS